MTDEMIDEWLEREEPQPEPQEEPQIRRFKESPLERRQQAFSVGHNRWDWLDG